MLRADVAVVGGGIVGLAHAYVAARSGLSVVVVDANKRPVGPSVRSFGLLGFTASRNKRERELALLSRSLWSQVLSEIGAWHRTEGSMYVIMGDDELEFARATIEQTKSFGIQVRYIPPEEVIWRCPPVRRDNLKGGLVSPENILVDPTEVVEKLTHLLKSQYGVQFITETTITGAADGYIGNDDFTMQAERTYLCTNTDFRTLYPNQYEESGLQFLKLQMLRCRPRDPNWRIGPLVHGVFTLLRYTITSQITPLPELFERLCERYPDYVKYGIHGVVCQMPNGEVIVGDSHEEPGDEPEVGRAHIEMMVRECVEMFMNAEGLEITDRWVGHYVKPLAEAVFRKELAPGVTSVIIPGGMGMTFSLGAAMESLQPVLDPSELNLR